jgi:eukaryotic-like serine/threonine-protein kinase
MNSRSIKSFFRVASLLLLLVTVALLAAITTMHFAIHGAEVQVPSLKGMTVAEARSVTSGLGLNLNVDNRYYSGEVAAGHILTQSPASGSVVRREWHVRVSESLGPQKVDVPNTVGLQERVAELQLRRAGLEVGATAHLPSSSATAGTVIAQDPPAHALDIAQPTVSLLVAAPDDEKPDGYVMPNLVGMPVLTAQLQLSKFGIKTAPPAYESVPIGPVGSGDVPPESLIKPGSVIAQNPPAGARVDQQTTVELTAAK